MRHAFSLVVLAVLATGCGSAPNSPDSTETCTGFGEWQNDEGTTTLYGHLTHDGAVVSVGDRRAARCARRVQRQHRQHQ
jgi:hypothetical protein